MRKAEVLTVTRASPHESSVRHNQGYLCRDARVSARGSSGRQVAQQRVRAVLCDSFTDQPSSELADEVREEINVESTSRTCR